MLTPRATGTWEKGERWEVNKQTRYRFFDFVFFSTFLSFLSCHAGVKNILIQPRRPRAGGVAAGEKEVIWPLPLM